VIYTPLAPGAVVGADLPLALKDIAFLRVKECTVTNQQEFGRQTENEHAARGTRDLSGLARRDSQI
jgi:hypothetical protein